MDEAPWGQSEQRLQANPGTTADPRPLRGPRERGTASALCWEQHLHASVQATANHADGTS